MDGAGSAPFHPDSYIVPPALGPLIESDLTISLIFLEVEDPSPVFVRISPVLKGKHPLITHPADVNAIVEQFLLPVGDELRVGRKPNRSEHLLEVVIKGLRDDVVVQQIADLVELLEVRRIVATHPMIVDVGWVYTRWL